jgi:hypothetical protein
VPRDYERTPKGLAEVHNVLWNDVALLYQRWTTFRALYLDSSVEQRECLSWAAGGFFTLLHRMLVDDLLLGIARLADPSSSSGQANLVLASLVEELNRTSEAGLRDEVKVVVNEFREASAFARPARNKRLAHRDLAVATGQSSELDYVITWDQIEQALKLAAKALNAVEKHFEGGHTAFSEFVHHKGADTLLRRLERAKEDREEYFRRKTGEAS